MTTPKQNRKIVQAVVTVAIIAALVVVVRWFLTDIHTVPEQSKATAQQTPSVVADIAAKADLASGREYIGRVESIQTVDLRPQVAGEIAQVHFKEGSIIKAGQLLFTLDSRQYQATVDLRKADLAKAEANHDRAVKYYDRLAAADKRSIPASDLDTAENDVLACKAAIDQAKASLRLAQIDLGHTKILAPIGGQIGKAAFTKGNYVTSAGEPLTSIVQVDPVRVVFSLPDRDYLEQIEAFKASRNSVYDATIKLADGKAYPFKGTRDFENNTMDEKTGTIMMRIRYKNDRGVLIPGSMVRLETKPLKSHVSVVIPQEAILADSQGDYVYTVDENNVVHQNRVNLGEEAGAMREVASGLTGGEKIVVRGLQSIRPEMTVNPIMQKTEGAKTPAELAKASVYDVQLISPDMGAANGGSSSEGNR